MKARAAEERDLPAILEILNFEILKGHSHFGTEPMALHELTSEFETSAARFPWWVVTDDQEGVLAVARASAWKARGAYAKTVEVGIYVRPELQGKGIGRALYSSFLPAVRSAGFHTLLGGIAQPNPASVRLHECFGFSHVGTLPQVGFKLGEWRDVGYWALVFEDSEK